MLGGGRGCGAEGGGRAPVLECVRVLKSVCVFTARQSGPECAQKQNETQAS